MTKQEFRDLAGVLWEHTQGELRFGIGNRSLNIEEACKEFAKLDKELSEKIARFADARQVLNSHIVLRLK